MLPNHPNHKNVEGGMVLADLLRPSPTLSGPRGTSVPSGDFTESKRKPRRIGKDRISQCLREKQEILEADFSQDH
jgi:hypothetical protein